MKLLKKKKTTNKPQNKTLNTHMHLSQSRLHKEGKKKRENQRWESKDSSQFSLTQLREGHR